MEDLMVNQFFLMEMKIQIKKKKKILKLEMETIPK